MAPHITHFRIRARPGERQRVIDHFDVWQRGRRHQAAGFVRFVLCSNVNDPDEFMAYAMFADRKSYDANSNHPDQNQWYQTLRSYLTSDPEWFDGTVEVQRMGQV
jgi:quinol monooxygenase YgiN